MQNPEIIIVPACFATIAYVAWVWLSTSQRKQRVKLLTDFHTRLLDKLGSVKDFGEFMQTDAGAKLMADLASEPVSAGPHDRIMRAAQIGIVFSVSSLIFVAASALTARRADRLTRHSVVAGATAVLDLTRPVAV